MSSGPAPRHIRRPGEADRANEKRRADQGPELYGDYPIDWWINAFAQKNREIETIEKAISEKNEYVSLFDGGKRFGQIYATEKIEQYKKFKEELPGDEAEASGA